MALRVRFQYPSGSPLGYSIERLADGLLYDFATSGPTAGKFAASPAQPIADLAAGASPFSGRYAATLSPTPVAQFTDGAYCVAIHNRNAGDQVVALLSPTMKDGDDAPSTMAAGVPGSDPWAVSLPGGYPAGTAGAILGTMLDAPISSRLSAGAYAPPPSPAQVAGAVWDEPTAAHVGASSFGARLDASVSSRLATAGYSAPLSTTQVANAVWDEPASKHTAAGSLGARLDAAVSSRLASTSYISPPTAAQVAGAVWDEPAASHTAAGSFGSRVDASISTRLAATSYATPPTPAQFAAAVWDEPAASHTATGSLGARLDASVSSRLAASGYVNPPTASQIADAVWDEPASHTTAGSYGARLDVNVSSRSTYSGGPVASVTAPVTVGTVQDKTGYVLASNGLDAIAIEPGINVRQAMVVAVAALAGRVSGSGSGSVTIKGANVDATRIQATTDDAGNRSTVTLLLPT